MTASSTEVASPNVLLVVLDSVRAQNLSLYGHRNDTTPYLKHLAEESIVYTSAWSPAVWTLPSHISMFTGYDLEEHGVTSSDTAIDPEATIFSQLSDRGYQTGVFSENTWLTEAHVGLKDSFDTVIGKPSVVYPDALQPGEFAHRNEYGQYGQYFKEALDHEYTAKSLVNGIAAKIQYDLPNTISDWLFSNTPGSYYANQLLEWIDKKDSDDPWAACINLMDAHRPYLPDEDADQWAGKFPRQLQRTLDDPVWPYLDGERPLWELRALEALYDGGIRQCDKTIKYLLNEMEACNTLEETVVIITGDHGEGFGEQSFIRKEEPVVEHKKGIHPVQTHVPLLLRPPGGDQQIVEEPVSLTQTANVIDAAVEGSLGWNPYSSDDPVRIGYTDVSAQQVEANDSQETSPARSVVVQREGESVKLTKWGNREVAVQVNDPQQACPISVPDISFQISDAFEGLSSTEIQSDVDCDIDDDTKRRLERLGYR